MSRVGYVTMKLAEELSACRVGDRLDKVQDLARRLDCGNGTVQAAFGVLDQAGAISVNSRGRLGTYVAAIDHALLWELSGSRSVSIAMPLPYSRRYEAIATGLQASFAKRSIPLTLAFIRGSAQRVRALREGRADLVLMSGMAASSQDNLEAVHDFGAQSYVAAHGLLLAAGKDKEDPHLVVGVDPESTDQVGLVAAVFGHLPPKQIIPMSYSQLDHSFQAGRIDATIWNLDEVSRLITADVKILPIAATVDQLNTHAVLVRTRSEQQLAVGIVAAISSALVTDCMQLVMAGDMTPTY